MVDRNILILGMGKKRSNSIRVPVSKYLIHLLLFACSKE